MQILAISLERTEEEKNMWKKLVHGEDNPRTKLKEQCQSHVVNDFCEINIKKYFFIPPNDVLNLYDSFTFLFYDV